jgi:catechol 2,3-dioxygenase-like lactoylglutathione lyase family enzyme
MPILRYTAFYSIALAAALAMPSLCQNERLQDKMPPEISAPTAASAASFSLSGVAHIALRVKDVAASVDFYHKLGFDHPFDRKNGDTVTESFIKINDTQFIELYPLDASQSVPGFLHLCFEGADLNALHDAYVAEGLVPTAVRTAGAGNRLFTMPGPQQASGPENIEYTQYLPGSLHSKDVGQHLGPDRVGDKMTVVALAMQDPAAARQFYLNKLGFHVSAADPARLELPGSSGEAVEIVEAGELGMRASILLTTADIDKASAQLTRQQVAFQRAASSATDAAGKPRTLDMISVTDPDGNIIRIAEMK